MEVEFEHAKGHAPAKLVVAKNLEDVAKIALAHLCESPDYYEALGKMEAKLEAKKSLGPMLLLPIAQRRRDGPRLMLPI
jgi:hypothetical protein